MFSKKHLAGLIFMVVFVGGCSAIKTTKGDGTKTFELKQPQASPMVEAFGIPPIEAQLTIPTKPEGGWPWSDIGISLGSIALGAFGINAKMRPPYKTIIRGVVNLFR